MSLTPRGQALAIGLMSAGIGSNQRNGDALAAACDAALEAQPDRGPIITIIEVLVAHGVEATPTMNLQYMASTVLTELSKARNSGEVTN